MLIIAICSFLFALFLFWQSNRKHSQTGIPSGRIIYTDTQSWKKNVAPLFSQKYHLVGKPDYLIKKNGIIIPVEVKSTRIGSEPYDSHVYQLSAYCMLVQENYHIRPAYGLIHYPNRTFMIDYTQDMELSLEVLLHEMRSAEKRKNPTRSHHSSSRCAGCGFRYICDQKL